MTYEEYEQGSTYDHKYTLIPIEALTNKCHTNTFVEIGYLLKISLRIDLHSKILNINRIDHAFDFIFCRT